MNRFRLWREYHRHEIRLTAYSVAGLLGLGLLVSGAIWLAHPIGPVETVQGRVEGLGYHETDLGSVPMASVKVEGQPIRIRMPARFGCAIGDRITLMRRPTRFGFRYVVGPNPRPCSRS